MANYKCLKQQEYTLGNYSIVPLRYEDRFSIMKWRNEQIYHLRQARPLTEEDQQRYFDNVVAKLFDQSKPDQILFSYLEKGVWRGCENCRMRTNEEPDFCPVCQQALTNLLNFYTE